MRTLGRIDLFLKSDYLVEGEEDKEFLNLNGVMEMVRSEKIFREFNIIRQGYYFHP